MSNALNISIIQFDIQWENPNENIVILNKLINSIEKTDVIVLPEMFSTGFTMKPKQFDYEHQEHVTKWMKKIAKIKKCAICGSILYKEEENYYNRFLWFDEDGNYIYYDKNHLFTLAKEHLLYKKGKKKASIIHYKNWKIYPQICYDLRFPESARNTLDYDVLLYVANWPEKRSYAWNILLKSRAIENQSFVIACNRIGKDNNKIHHSGNSQIINYEGIVLKETVNTNNRILQHTLIRGNLIKYRTRYPFLKDQ